MTGDTARIFQRALLGEAIEGAEGAGVFVWNEDRRYIAVNDEACRLVGMEREALIGMPVGSLSEDHATAEIASVRRASFLSGSSSFVRADGESVDLDWVTMHTRVAGLPCLISVCWPR
jgi:PAS domain S-box-containing protein